MQPHLSDLQFFVAIVALALAAILFLAAVLNLRKNIKSAPFRNYFQADFDQPPCGWDRPRQASFSRLDEARPQLHAFQARAHRGA